MWQPGRGFLLLTLTIAMTSLFPSHHLAQAALCDGVSGATGTALATVRIAAGLDKPLYLTASSNDVHRLYVVEQDGRIRIIKDGVLLATPFLDISSITGSPADGRDDEQGLLGLAFSPSYISDGYFFVYHTDNAGTSNLVERFHVSTNRDLADLASRTTILSIPHPTFGNHNGGNLQFSPADGYLYIGTGDGGDACDAGPGAGNAQNTSDLRGKLLRIDVIPVPPPQEAPYRIPPDQPAYPRPEIFAVGLRNPWRWSFDRATSDLYIADVGQNTWEEVNYLPAPNAGRGANFGWQNYEGNVCPPPGCGGVACSRTASQVNPVLVYSHDSGGCSITGGYVYRGCRLPDLAAQRRYFYTDFCAADLESFVASGSTVTSEVTYTSQLSPSIDGTSIAWVTSWGEDARGEPYIVSRLGDVFKVIPVLRSLEVSGTGVGGAAPPTPLWFTGSGWAWEDFAFSSGEPIDRYRVYRSDGNGSGTFQCVYTTPAVTPPARPAASWPGGDPAVPAPGALFSYIVTAVRTSRAPEESSPGAGTNGTARTLGTFSCP